MAYWLFENPNRRELMAHNERCGHACHGRNCCGHSAGWHGPYQTIKELARAAISLGRDFKWCSHCAPVPQDRHEYYRKCTIGLAAFVRCQGMEEGTGEGRHLFPGPWSN